MRPPLRRTWAAVIGAAVAVAGAATVYGKHAGGAYVGSVARGDLGKNGTCTAPLPAPPAGASPAG